MREKACGREEKERVWRPHLKFLKKRSKQIMMVGRTERPDLAAEREENACRIVRK